MLTGELLPANEAFRIGLVNHIYPANQLLEKAVELAGGERVARRGPGWPGVSDDVRFGHAQRAR